MKTDYVDLAEWLRVHRDTLLLALERAASAETMHDVEIARDFEALARQLTALIKC